MLCVPWTTYQELANCGCGAEELDVDRVEELIDAASEALHLLSNSQFTGPCTTVYRPCHSASSSALDWWGSPTVPVRQDGAWLNLGPCGCGAWGPAGCTCGCAALHLPVDYPVGVVVREDGVVLAASAYRLAGRELHRVTGAWRCCQDLSLSDTEVGTWSVTITHGLDPPALGRLAARDLAAELVRACRGVECRLPARTTAVVRQGISYELDPAGLAEGAVGIYSVDLFLAAVNPEGRRAGRSSFASPSLPETWG